jgi:NOL1/NOP2/fmu family ribosome biogenesis protein
MTLPVTFIKSKEKKEIVEELEKEYGITELPYMLIETGREKLRGFSGSLTKEELIELSDLTRIELIGMYLISRRDDDFRINFDALPLFKEQITKNLIQIDKQQLELWLRGSTLDIKSKRGIVILKYGDDFVGVGKSNTETIFNYVPKERKLKTPLPKT